MVERKMMWEQRLDALEAAMAETRAELDRWRRLEVRQSQIIGVLVEAKLWSVDPSSGRSTRADGHSDADGPGGKGGVRIPDRNPTVRQDPPRWKGPAMQGRRFATCTPAYLRQLASYIDWCADRDDEVGACTGSGKPRAPFLRADAELARLWADRLTAGLP